MFTVVFWTTIHTFLGWPANENDIPEKVLIHWVIIKEPNKAREFDGAIYITLETAEEMKGNRVAKFFGYGSDRIEPRLFKLKYNRKLHEQLQKLIKSRLSKGQPIMGKLSKDKEVGKGKKGDGKKSNNKGDGSESQEQDWEFHELLPSEIHSKPEQ